MIKRFEFYVSGKLSKQINVTSHQMHGEPDQCRKIDSCKNKFFKEFKWAHSSVERGSTDKLHCGQSTKEKHRWDSQCIHCQRSHCEHWIAAVFSFERSERTVDPFLTVLDRRNSKKLFTPNDDFPSSEPECSADNRKSYWGDNQQNFVIEHNNCSNASQP